MRQLSAPTAEATQKYLTAPLYLVEIMLPIPRRLSSRETVVWTPLAGTPLLWTESGIDVTFGQSGAGGSMSAELTLPNHDRAWHQPALSLARDPARVTIIQLYGREPFAAEDGEVLFEGVTDAVPRIADNVKISCVTDGESTAYSPRIPIQSFAPSPRRAGDIITWGSVDLTLSHPR